jgi:hypothetical protein
MALKYISVESPVKASLIITLTTVSVVVLAVALGRVVGAGFVGLMMMFLALQNPAWSFAGKPYEGPTLYDGKRTSVEARRRGLLTSSLTAGFVIAAMCVYTLMPPVDMLSPYFCCPIGVLMIGYLTWAVSREMRALKLAS